MILALLTPALASGVLYKSSTYGSLGSLDAEVQVAGRVAGTTTLWTWPDLPAGRWTFAAVVPDEASVAGLRYRHAGGEWVSAGTADAESVSVGPGPDGEVSALLPGTVFSTPLPNLDVNGTLELELSWQQVLAADGGRLSVAVPLDDGGLNPTAAAVAVSFSVVGLEPLSDAALAPEGDLAIAGTTAAAGWSGTLGDADAAVLDWTEEPGAFGVELLAYRPELDPFTGEEGGPGYGLLVLVPGPVDPDARVDQLFTFVLDVSDSMAGAPLETAVAAGSAWLRALAETDRFNVIPYASQAWPFRGTAPLATPGAVDRAVSFLERQTAGGLSDPEEALTTALTLADDTLQHRRFLGCGGTRRGPDGDGPPVAESEITAVDGGLAAAAYVVLLTDGRATSGVTDPAEIAARVREQNGFGASLYALGVGPDVDTALLTQLALDNRGEARFLAGPDDVAEAVAALQERLADPLLVQPEVAVGGAWDPAPAALEDLAGGHELLLAFRFDEAGPTDVLLSGLRGPDDILEFHTIDLPLSDERMPVIARAWAQLRVRDLDGAYGAGDWGAYAELQTLVETYGVASEVVTLAFDSPESSADGAATAVAGDSAAGCGCTTGPPPFTWAFLVGLGAAGLRRREVRPGSAG